MKMSDLKQTSVILCVLVLLGVAADAQLFSQLSNRYRVGDPNVANPLSWTEGPKCLTAGDLNADGLSDLITGNLDGSISVLLADGNNALQPQTFYPAGGSMRAVVCADINEDQKLDVIGAGILSGVSLFLGQGDGTLTFLDQLHIGDARALAAGDCDRDGHVDLLVGCGPEDCGFCEDCNDRRLLILYGDGHGRFLSQSTLMPDHSGCFYDVELCDMDRDGWLDVLALDLFGIDGTYQHGHVLLFRGLGGRQFGAWQALITRGRGPRDFCVAYVDETVSGQGPPSGSLPDIVVANRDSATIDIFCGQPGFTFSDVKVVSAGDSPRAVATGDLNGDGLTDLVVANRNANTVSVLRGFGDGRFSAPVEFPAGTSPRQIVLADLTGDGVLDAGVANRLSQDVSALVGRSDLVGFLLPGGYYPAGINPKDVVAEDFNEDGSPDVATVNLRSNDVRVRLNEGHGTLGDEVVYPVDYQPSCLAAGDVDRDGHMDLVVAAIGSPHPEAGTSGTLVCLLGLGNGTFEAAESTASPLPAFSPHWLRLGDLNGDQKLDVAVTGLAGELMLFRGDGRGRFRDPVLLEAGRDTRAVTVALGDVNNDGRLDIATSGGKVLLNDDHFFDPGWAGQIKRFGSDIREIQRSWLVECGDLDEDGNLDLVVTVTFERPDPIAVYYGRGDGTFLEPDIYGGPDEGVVDVIAQDMDGDEIIDLAVGNRCGGDVILFKGKGDRSFEHLQTVQAYSVEGIAAADFNHDGQPDVVGAGLGVWTILSGEETRLTTPREFNPLGVAVDEGVYINEIMANNEQYYLHGEASPDWVELFNLSAHSANLSDWSLLQHISPTEIRSWTFPPGTTIGPMEHLVVFCEKKGLDDEAAAPGLWCHEFELSRKGEALSLLDYADEIVDRVDFPSMPPDISYARYMDGAPYLCYNPVPTLGTANVRPANLEPDIDLGEPFLSADATALGINAKIFDDVGVAYAAVHYQLTPDEPFEEVILQDDGLHGDFAAGDGCYGGLLPALPPGQRIAYWVRVVDLEGALATSPGEPAIAANLHVLTVPPAENPLRFSEAVPDNATGYRDEEGKAEDWLELVNCGAEAVVLSDYILTKDFYDPNETHFLPADMALQPGERIVLFCDDDVEDGPLHMHFKLDRDGDRIFLMKRGPDEDLVWMDEISFGSTPTDTAYGRAACGEEARILARPTPGGPNIE